MRKSFFSKPTKRIFRVLLILLMVSLFTTGCGKRSKIEKGFGYTWTPKSIMFGIRADTDTFSKNDVSFNLYYGVHDIGHDSKYDSDPKKSYQKEGNETIFFGLYICDKEHSFDIVNDSEITDYKMIENYYFVKDLSEEDAFSEEYGFSVSYWTGITYNHSEKFIVPTEIFANETGSFVIKLIAFRETTNEGRKYYVSTAGDFEITYHLVDENTIKLNF